MNNGINVSNKPQVRTYFTSKTAAELPNGAAYVPVTTSFINKTNSPVTVNTVSYQPGQAMIANGQIVVYNQNGQAVTSATSGTSVRGFFFAQGRDTSNDTPVLGDRPFEQSEIIPADAAIRIRYGTCSIDKNSAWVIGAETGAPNGQIPTNENSRYSLTIAYRGHFAYKLNARNNPATFPGFEVVGTWTQLGLATATERRDYIVQNLGYNVNRMSRLWLINTSDPAFAISVSSTSGVGTQLSAITVGSDLVIAYRNGNTALPITVHITNAIFESIAAAIASGKVAGTSTVVPQNTSTAGTDEADQLLIIALDRPIVDTDRERFVKNRLDIGLNEGFAVNTACDKVCDPFEGYGLGRHVLLDYQEYAELNKKWRVQNPSGNAFQFPADMFTNRAYFLLDIEYYSVSTTNAEELTAHPKLITLAFPCCDATMRTSWEGLLNGFFATLPNCKFEGANMTSATSIDITPSSTPCSSGKEAPFKTA